MRILKQFLDKDAVKYVLPERTNLLRKKESLRLSEDFNAKNEILDWCEMIDEYEDWALKLIDYFK